ncbi:MAG: SlyX family protein [Desulfovibrio sp.]
MKEKQEYQTEELQQRLELLESTVAQQDTIIEELNSALVSQQEQLMELEKQFKVMVEIMQKQQNEESNHIENLPPPHYNQSF